MLVSTTASYNTCVGYQAGRRITTAQRNTLMGVQCGEDITTAINNTGVGADCLRELTTGADNTAVGRESLQYCTTGYHNTAVGQESAKTLTTGFENTCIGHDAGKDLTDGHENSFVGQSSANNVTTGHSNVVVGHNAGTNITTGDKNLILGTNSNTSGSNSQREIVLGLSATGKGNITFFVDSYNGVYHGGNTTTWSTTSDRRIKKNIVDNNEGLSLINQIAVKNFEYKTAEEIESAGEVPAHEAVSKTGTQIGVIAQELQEVRSNWVTTRDNGTMSVTGTDDIVWHLVNAVKELSAENEALKARLDAAGL